MSERRPRERASPQYPLADVANRFAADDFSVTLRVQRHLDRRGWDGATVVSCICSTAPADFRKSQEHLGRPGVWLDIYKPVFVGRRMYVKFTACVNGAGFVVLCFCVDGEEH